MYKHKYISMYYKFFANTMYLLLSNLEHDYISLVDVWLTCLSTVIYLCKHILIKLIF